MQLHNISLPCSQRPRKTLARQGWTAAVQLDCGFHAKKFPGWDQEKNRAPLVSPQEGDLQQLAYPQVLYVGIPSWDSHELIYRVYGPREQSLPFLGLMTKRPILK